MPTSFEFWRGKSLFDASPIVGIVCASSANRKTGPMAQAYILSADVHPVELDSIGTAAICGDCPLQKMLRPGVPGSNACYVNRGHGPAAIWSSWQAGRVPRLHEVGDEHLAKVFGRCQGLRYGAYGEPVAIPRFGWVTLEEIVSRFSGNTRTGYTHAWREHRFRDWRSRIMASVESGEDAWQARELGWRYFRIGAEKLPGDILCPASDEFHKIHGYKKQCHECGACDGCSVSSSRVSIYIPPHSRKGLNLVTT
jgi:hypothetical protein